MEKEGEYGEDGDRGGGHRGGEREEGEGEKKILYMVYKETIDDLKADRCVLTINKPSCLEPSAWSACSSLKT